MHFIPDQLNALPRFNQCLGSWHKTKCNLCHWVWRMFFLHILGLNMQLLFHSWNLSHMTLWFWTIDGCMHLVHVTKPYSPSFKSRFLVDDSSHWRRVLFTPTPFFITRLIIVSSFLGFLFFPKLKAEQTAPDSWRLIRFLVFDTLLVSGRLRTCLIPARENGCFFMKQGLWQLGNP